MRKTYVKSEIVLGSLIYANPNKAPAMFQENLDPIIGSVVKKNEDGTYEVEWLPKEGDAFISVEKETFIRSGLFNMKVYKEAMGETLPLV